PRTRARGSAGRRRPRRGRVAVASGSKWSRRCRSCGRHPRWAVPWPGRGQRHGAIPPPGPEAVASSLGPPGHSLASDSHFRWTSFWGADQMTTTIEETYLDKQGTKKGIEIRFMAKRRSRRFGRDEDCVGHTIFSPEGATHFAIAVSHMAFKI